MKQQFIMDSAQAKNYEIPNKKRKKRNIESHTYEKDKKTYVTLLFNKKNLQENAKIIEEEFLKNYKFLLKSVELSKPILILGLGNKDILSDSFGPKVVEKLIATNQYNDFITIPKVALFCPETTAKTGISSFKLIEMVVKYLKPGVIVIIDSFLTKDKDRLNYCIELNNCGIVFASELRDNKEISEQTFHVPIISIGYPTMIKEKNLYMERIDLQDDMECVLNIVSKALNKIVK